MSKETQTDAREKYFHILLKPALSQCLFQFDTDYECFIALLIEKTHQYGNDLLAYSLYEDYIHIIVNENRASSTDPMIHGLKTAYRKYYNQKYKLSSSIFTSGYDCQYIYTKKDLLLRIRFLHQKPITRKKCTSLTNKYTSYMYYLTPEQPCFINRYHVFRLLYSSNNHIAKNFFIAIHQDMDDSIYKEFHDALENRVLIAKKILFHTLDSNQVAYEDLQKCSEIRDKLILDLHNKSGLNQQEIADFLSISRHITGRVIRTSPYKKIS